MSKVKDVIEANRNYETEQKKLSKLYQNLLMINDNLDLVEVENSLSYQETKELYNLIRYSSCKPLQMALKGILDNKKSKEYPEINGVHYYPVIKELDLAIDEKVHLDTVLKENYDRRGKIIDISVFSDNILAFLTVNKIIERQYIFHCNCGSDDCYDKIISETEFEKLKAYWVKEAEGTTTAAEDKEMHYGCFETGCWNDATVEVCCLEDFNKNLKRIEYKIVTEPDMTLDNL